MKFCKDIFSDVPSIQHCWEKKLWVLLKNLLGPQTSAQRLAPISALPFLPPPNLCTAVPVSRCVECSKEGTMYYT